jgi:hypothetical protein
MGWGEVVNTKEKLLIWAETFRGNRNSIFLFGFGASAGNLGWTGFPLILKKGRGVNSKRYSFNI